MGSAAQVDQPVGPVHQHGQRVRRDDVDRHDRRTGVDPGIVDDRIHASQPVGLLGDLAGLVEVGQVADHHVRTPVDERADGVEAITIADVHHHIVPGGQQGVCSGATQPVRRSGHQHAHGRRPSVSSWIRHS